MPDTFILLSRSLIESEVFASQKLLKIWLWCLLKANYKDRFVSVEIGRGESMVKLKRGQFLFGRFKAEDELDIDGSTVYRLMKKLEEIGNISIKSSSHYSVITINNYDTYQDPNNYKQTADEQPLNNTRTTREQHVNTDKKDNNVNKVKNKKPLNFQFKEKEFPDHWTIWIEYKQTQFKFKYHSDSTEQTAINSLYKLSSGNFNTAKDIIDRSISNGWKGLFKLDKEEKSENALVRAVM